MNEWQREHKTQTHQFDNITHAEESNIHTFYTSIWLVAFNLYRFGF